MQKKWPLIAGLVLIVLASWWFFKSPQPAATDASDSAALGPTLAYDTRVEVKQSVQGQDQATIVDISGVLLQSADFGKNYLSEWQSVDSFSMMGSAQDTGTREGLVGKSVDSHYVPKDGAFAHSFAADFPKDYLPFHASLFHRTLLPMTLEELKSVQKITTKERDEVGEYEAIYTLEGQKVTKRWTRYFKDFIKVDGKRNNFVFEFGSDGRLESVHGDLILHYRQDPPTRFQIIIDMKLKGKSDKVVSRVDSKSAITYNETDIAKGQDLEPASTVSFEEGMTMVDAITEDSDSAEAYRIFQSLKYAIDLDPSRADAVISKIRSITERDPSSRRKLSVLFGALAQAKDSGISNSLAEMAESCPDTFCKIQAIAGVNSHPNPTTQAMDKMLELADKTSDAEIAGNALLAAGSAGSRMDDPGPELSSTLNKIVNDPSKAEIKPAAIAAMGNHGSADYLPVLEKNLADPSVTIRAAAAYSMRYIPEESVDKSLVNAISSEKDQNVIRDVLKALDYRSLSAEDYSKVAQKTLAIDDVETAKLGARVLIQAYREDPSVVASSIAEMSAGLKNSEVKEYLDTEVANIKRDNEEAAKRLEEEQAQ